MEANMLAIGSLGWQEIVIIGAIFLVFFVRNSWMTDAAAAAGGSWTVWDQLGVQAVAVVMAVGYAVVATLVILLLVEKTLGLRTSAKGEMKGLDDHYHGEKGYGMVNPN